MRETLHRGTAKAAQRTQQSLLRLVREACEALLSTQPSIIKSVTVSRIIEDRGGARFATKMAARLAQEYGLNAEMSANGRTIAVRLTRPAAHSCGETILSGHTTETGY